MLINTDPTACRIYNVEASWPPHIEQVPTAIKAFAFFKTIFAIPFMNYLPFIMVASAYIYHDLIIIFFQTAGKSGIHFCYISKEHTRNGESIILRKNS